MAVHRNPSYNNPLTAAEKEEVIEKIAILIRKRKIWSLQIDAETTAIPTDDYCKIVPTGALTVTFTCGAEEIQSPDWTV